MGRPPRILTILLTVLSAAPGVVSQDAAPPDSDGDGVPDSEEARWMTSPRDRDTDRDGLPDGWEIYGIRRGGSDEPLPIWGADPLKPDVFVEIDWMESVDGDPSANARIAYAAAVDVVRAFRRSGKDIRIHFDLGPTIEDLIPGAERAPDVDFTAFRIAPDEHKVLPFQEVFQGRPAEGARSSLVSLYDVYRDGYHFRPSRRNVFYYVVFAEQSDPDAALADPESSIRRYPFSDGFSDDMARTDGLLDPGTRVATIFRKPASAASVGALRYQYAVSLLHELGHGFGFGHGGSRPGFEWDRTNYKPNYPSIMNYRFQFCGVDLDAGRPVLDFSHGRLTVPLHEVGLLEPAGMGKLDTRHILECTGLVQLESHSHPENIDWNRDGVLATDPVVQDVNENGRIDLEPSRDHDDWGKLVRDGFDGIGENAFRGRSAAGEPAHEVELRLGDFDGDGREDAFLLAGSLLAFAIASADGRLEATAATRAEDALGTWRIGASSTILVGDFLGTGRDQVFAHRDREIALFGLVDGTPRLAWHRTGRVDGGPTPGWEIGPGDRFLPARLLSGGPVAIVATNGRSLAVIETPPGTAEPGSPWQRDDWPFARGSDRSLSMRGGPPLEDGSDRLLAHYGGSLLAITGPPGAPGIVRLDAAGVLPAVESSPEPASGWAVSTLDGMIHADLDGDGSVETVLHGTRRIGIVGWDGGQARLVWAAADRLLGVFPLSDRDRLLHGQFVAGGGEELVVSNGQSWVTLGWDRESSSPRLLGIDNGYLSDIVPGSELRPGQRLLAGKFLAIPEDVVCVHGGTRLVFASFHGDGFSPFLTIGSRVGEWYLESIDTLTPANVDSDPELEIIVRKGALHGVLDFSPAPRSIILGGLDPETLTFEPESVFRRGDVNSDREIDISDVVAILSHLFLGTQIVRCHDAADVDDSGEIDLTDAIFLLKFLFNRGDPPGPPGPFRAGIDPTLDAIGCDAGVS